MTAHTEIYEKVTANVIALLERGVPAWRQGWNIRSSSYAPSNPLSGTVYSGVNAWLLYFAIVMEGYASPYFGTFNQIQDAGGKLVNAKGKGIHLLKYVEIYEKWADVEARGITLANEDDYKKNRKVRFVKPTTFTVFNLAAHTEGMSDKIPVMSIEKPAFSPIESAAKVWEGFAAAPTLTTGKKACYYPSLDTIEMPPAETFPIPSEYYSTLFHEGIHATGAAQRLNRDGITGAIVKGSNTYAREELIAEMGAAMLCAVAGIENTTLENNAAYCQSWLKVLKGDPGLIVTAAAAAMKAADYILGKPAEAQAEAEAA